MSLAFLCYLGSICAALLVLSCDGGALFWVISFMYLFIIGSHSLAIELEAP